MTDEKKSGAANGNGQGTSDQADPSAGQIHVLGQYIKDLSFESPNTPDSLQGAGENPNLNIEVNVGASQLGDDTYESAIDFKARASNKTGVIYNLEIIYAGAFQLKNLPSEALQPVLLINSPALLYPFLRRLIADLTREGGFPPLLLDPIDFAGLYARKLDRALRRL